MTETPVEKPLRIFLLAVGSTAFFACMNVFVKLAAEYHSLPQILFFRSAIGLLPIILLMYMTSHGLSLLHTKRHVGHFVRGLVGIISMFCFFMSFHLLPLTEATSLHFASPLILTALAVPFLKERVGRHRWAAVLVGLLGVLFMMQPSGSSNLLGSFIAICAAFLSAIAMINVRKLGTSEHALTIAFYFSVYGTLIGGATMLFAWSTPTPYTWFLLLMTGLLGGAGQICLTAAYAGAPAAYVSPFSYLAIIFAALFDIVIWSVYPGWHTVVGSTIVMASGLYILFREARKHGRPRMRTNIYAAQPVQPTEKDRADSGTP